MPSVDWKEAERDIDLVFSKSREYRTGGTAQVLPFLDEQSNSNIRELEKLNKGVDKLVELTEKGQSKQPVELATVGEL